MTKKEGITIIVALDESGGVGYQGKLPWPHIRADMAWFWRHTVDKTVVMGRKTFESLGKALPRRKNIVLSSTLGKAEGVNVLPCWRPLIPLSLEEDVVVIGGPSIYKTLLPHCNRMLVTRVHGFFTCDTFFPEVGDDWYLKERQAYCGEKSPFQLSFLTYSRR